MYIQSQGVELDFESGFVLVFLRLFPPAVVHSFDGYYYNINFVILLLQPSFARIQFIRPASSAAIHFQVLYVSFDVLL